MDASLWHQKWENNENAFHKSTANPLLITHFEAASLVPGVSFPRNADMLKAVLSGNGFTITKKMEST